MSKQVNEQVVNKSTKGIALHLGPLAGPRSKVVWQSRKKGAKTVTYTLTILGKKRKLTGEFGNYFLDNPKDVLSVGVFCGLPLHLWRDENYLNRIRARKEQRR